MALRLLSGTSPCAGASHLEAKDRLHAFAAQEIFNDLIDVPEGIEGDELFEWEAAERMEFDQCFGWYRDRVEDQL